MSDTFLKCGVYDLKRDRFLDRGDFATPEAAIACFDLAVNHATKNWAKREVERFFLMHLGKVTGIDYVAFAEPVCLRFDWQVELDADVLWSRNPPHDAAAEEAFRAEVARLRALDEARRLRFANAMLEAGHVA